MAGRFSIVGVAVGAVVAAGVWTLWSQHQPEPVATTPTAKVSQPARLTSLQAAAAQLPVAPPPQMPPQLTPVEGLRELQAQAERFEALARYPRWSQPLDLLGDTLADEDTLHIQASDESAGQPVLTVYTEHRTFEAPEPITLHAHVKTPDGAVAAELTANVFDGVGMPVTELRFSREGLGYVTSFAPPASASANNNYSIRVHAVGPHQEQRDALLEIMYNQPFAHLTGNFRDRLDNGDLLIEAEVSVQRAAEFRINGSLYGAADQQQIASAEAGAKLAAGTAWLPLKFHGLILREQQVDGPYLLRFVALTAQTADAEVGMRPLQNAYTTQPYVADAFNGEAQHDAQWLAEAATVREHIERTRQQLGVDLHAKASK